ncbi:symmetrical bis(5'-nucleosyl)-tetraphosphatase [Tepidicella baoligensis]|uniref:symmetrical bis(5'-nucleosyl)-tetraphosphatase n=1 Tax=Tepidicella baoligensis TaxID=2707016 RepID=UPI0015DB3A01|nr:symmetrical bis(5'-nucleosyl)-tetraphosphatase [Tepidicella baoligensis]
MSLYLIGDVQGCDASLQRLLDTLAFSPSRDTLVLLGDLVNRGPDSLGVLRRMMALQGSAHCLLGNHDLHLLAVAHGVRKAHRTDTLDAILLAKDREHLLDWVRQRPLALRLNGWLLVHAGVLPQWSAEQTLTLAEEVSQMLRSTDGAEWLRQMYGNQPDHWRDDWPDTDRWRVVVNALTRLRFCNAQGVMEFATKDGAAQAPEGFMPWFEVPGRRSSDTPIAFGHWSTLGLLNRPHLLGLDTGCIWGGSLSAARLSDDGTLEDIIQVRCPQAQRPGR